MENQYLTCKLCRLLLLAVLLMSCSLNLIAQQSWKEIRTVEELCTSYPERMQYMLDQFNLDYPGLEKVKAAYEKGNIVVACQHLLAYYQNGHTVQELRKEQPEKTDQSLAEADTILNNVFIIQNVRGQLPFTEDGHRDWYYKGPNNDREWAWLSNRHSQLAEVFSAYFETGNPKYARYIDLFLRDFIIKSMPYPAEKSGTSVWRGLEVAARAKVWSRIFYGMINSEYLSPATQLLMLSSLPEHAHYNRNFHAANNWLTMEISALATVAANFPEYKAADEWMAYSIQTMTESMKEQVYADGTQTELTSHYHNVALHNFELFKEICDRAGQSLPDFYLQTMEAMYSYIAHAVRPSGYRILNNDGDKGSDRELIMSGAEKFKQPGWAYIASNGNSGTKPMDGPSYFYPWAGQLISRSGFDVNAHWSFFDMGPWGSGHQHNDKLHLSIAAYGKDLLVDAGRFAYTGEVADKFRPYAKGSAGHNLILIDHHGQGPGPRLAEAPVENHHIKITDDFDYASHAFDRFMDIEGEAEHIRSVFYVRSAFWLVVDRIITDRPRVIETLWHWHPDCVVELDGSNVRSHHENARLSVMPLSDQPFEVSMIKGQEEPEIQGWYSPEYNIYEPNILTRYQSSIEDDSSLVWLLLPSDDEWPEIEARILSENDQEIRLEITSEDESWQMTIPFQKSADARLVKK